MFKIIRTTCFYKEVEMRLFLEVAFWYFMMLNTSSYMLDHIIETMGQECQRILESQMAPEEANLELIITEWPVKQEEKHIPQWGYRGKCHFLKMWWAAAYWVTVSQSQLTNPIQTFTLIFMVTDLTLTSPSATVASLIKSQLLLSHPTKLNQVFNLQI